MVEFLKYGKIRRKSACFSFKKNKHNLKVFIELAQLYLKIITIVRPNLSSCPYRTEPCPYRTEPCPYRFPFNLPYRFLFNLPYRFLSRARPLPYRFLVFRLEA